jgi:hypothetical protein
VWLLAAMRASSCATSLASGSASSGAPPPCMYALQVRQQGGSASWELPGAGRAPQAQPRRAEGSAALWCCGRSAPAARPT